ncbi:hypothetical protein KKE34_04990 [Patescibacteria group bacterium]|nr:hypothetical protein [Patescibacteria group bacterium]MBU1885930.1 hypothetical protein [Patescibacteria group bacterium]
MTKKTIIIDQIRDIIYQELLIDATQIDITDNLEVALGINLETDFMRLVFTISQKFGLSTETKELLSQVRTLEQLASIVIEEAELG